MLVRITKPDFVFDNESGRLTQLVHDGWKQVNVILSNAGCTRGGHYHKYNDEAFYIISGSFRLTLYRDGVSESHEFIQNEMFVIPSYVSHEFLFHEDTLLVSLYSNGVESSDTDKDIWRYET